MIFDATPCALGEGPLWHPKRQTLLWFDILGKRLHSTQQHWQFQDHVSAAGWVDRDRLLLASQSALSLFDLTTGTSEILTPLEADNPTTRSNDGRADPQGGFWIGTMGLKAEKAAGAIYRYYKGELRKLYSDITVSNAICFHPDGQTAFFADTDTHIINRVPLDAAGWPAADPIPHIDLRKTGHRPDGAVVDSTGILWNAQWGAGRIASHDADGTFLTEIAVPATQSTCPAFGGPDLTTLFCTSAANGLAGDLDGKTFAFETNHIGQREHRVIL